MRRLKRHGYDDASRLTNANNANSNVTHVYDAAGRLTRDQQQVIGLGIKNVDYPLHDDDGNLKQISAAGVYDYTFGYDAAGRFDTISTGGSTKFEYDYDAASNETHRYTHLSGGIIDQIYGRDSLNRMSSRGLKKNGATIAGTTESYTYDHMNRITEVNHSGVADSFGYYWSGELLTAGYGGGPHAPYTEGQDPDLDTTDTVDLNANYQPPDTEEPEPTPPPDDTPPSDSTANTAPAPGVTPSDTPPAEDPAKTQKTLGDYLGDGNLGPDGPGQPDLPTGRSVSYTLDKAGNRTSVTDNVNGNATYVLNPLNQYTSVAGSSVVNGGEHEIQTYNNVGYTYINDERLATVKTPPTNPTYTYTLAYDALGRCVKRTLNGVATYYVYDGEKPILEYRSGDLSNPAKNVYGKGIDEILMRYDPSFTPAVTYYYQQDHEGSVTHLLNTSGNVIESYKYDAFGAPAIYDANGTQLSSSAYSNRFLFTGREYANLFGFYEYRARAYNPTLGRFMSEDPKLFDAGDYNLFRYCHNDPIDMTDPMGTIAYADAPITNPEIQASYTNARDAMAKWADSSNNFQGTFAQFAAREGLTMGQELVRGGLVPITKDRSLGSRTPRQLGVEAAMQAQKDSNHGDIYSYNVYQLGEQVIFQKSFPADAGSFQDTEAVLAPPTGAVFLANGHVHRENKDNRSRGSSHSELDKNLSRGRIPGIHGTGPVTFVKEHGKTFYEFSNEKVTPLNSDGEPWRP